LRRHRQAQDKERRRLGPVWQDYDLVFANTVGGPLARQSLLPGFFLPVLDRAALPRIRFHDLRHTAAMPLLAEGVHPKVVGELLGHSAIAVTVDLYSHVTATMHRQAVEALDQVLGGQNGGQEHRL
jgi:integrase